MALDASIIRRVRNLVPDTDPIYGPAEDSFLFTDENIEDFYADGNESVKWAAGLAKMAVGGSEALILKVIKNYETSTDGASLMRQWTLAGRELIKQAQDEATDKFTNVFDLNQPDHLRTRNYGVPEATPHWYN